MDRDLKSMKIEPTHELLAKAHYFLASNGIDSQISRPIDTSRSFEIAPLENHTDIESFMKEEHEIFLINILEEQREVNFNEFYNRVYTTITEEKERERIEKDENTMDYKDFERVYNSSGITRIDDYANVIYALNDNRLLDTDYDIFSSLSKICNVSDLKKSQDSAYESWSIMNHLVNKSNVEQRLEGRFMSSYVAQPYNSAEATNTRRTLINTSRSWLEQQFAQYTNDVVNRNATKLQVGGIPSVTHRLRAFINHVFKTSNGWNDDRLEIVDGLPIWAFLYLLIRSGNMSTATKFIDTNREMFASERKFVPYYEEFISSPLHCTSKATQDAILADYYKFNYGDNVVDPYKILIYKIIGRCELHIKSYPDVIKTTEDYIWLQLMLVREFSDVERYAFERYRLEDLQKDISSLGSNYFDTDQTNPWIYFKILLLTLQFEEAVDHLYKEKRLRLESVHFAIALAYSGLLKIPSSEKAHSYNILLVDDENRPTLNFARLIYQYVQVYISKNSRQAVHYLSLLTLYSPKQGYSTNEMIELAKSYICRFAMSSKDFKNLLGSHEDKRIPGLIDQVRGLLNINTETEYAQQIIYPIAEKCVQTGHCMDAVYAYSLSGDYNSMVDVLAKELSDALQQPLSYRITDPSLSEKSNEEIIQFAVDTMTHFEKLQHINVLVDDYKRNTVRILILLLQFRIAYEQGQYEQAMNLINSAQVIPLGNCDLSQVQYYAMQFEKLAETIKKNIPELLLNVMDILYKVWSDYISRAGNNTSSVLMELEGLEEKARSVLRFTGLIKFSIPSDIMVRLNKVDTLMSARRRTY